MVVIATSDRSVVQTEDILEFLKAEMGYREIHQKILQYRLIQTVAQSRSISVSPEEIQLEAERIRRERGLEKAADTLAWLTSEQVTLEDWEAGLKQQLLSHKLKETLFAQKVERVFAEQHLNFDRVVLYQILVSHEQFAQELFYQLEEGEISFYEAAYLYDLNPERRRRCGFEGILYRWQVQPQLSAVVFGAEVQQVIFPVKTDGGYQILLVDEFLPAQLTDEVRETILDQLFRDWINSEMPYFLHG
jgi:parvulin-like peptidyl-prolyl isomerase